MSYKKFRWSKDYEAAEEELELLLAKKGSQLGRWELPAYAEVAAATLPATRQLWCAEGSLRLHFDQQIVSLQPGDAITIDPETTHSLVAGVAGCVCYEARP